MGRRGEGQGHDAGGALPRDSNRACRQDVGTGRQCDRRERRCLMAFTLRAYRARPGLGEHEVVAILELKRKHHSMGLAQLRAQLKRFKGWRLSLKAIQRVLRAHGYRREMLELASELLHAPKRPVDIDEPRLS